MGLPRRFVAGALAGALLASGGETRAEPPGGKEGAAATTHPAGLRGRVGTDLALRLIHSSDADDRLRGLERVASLHTPEALDLLQRACGPSVPAPADARVALDGVARSDPRALLVTVRGLREWIDQESARTALASILGAPAQSLATRVASVPSSDPSADEAEGAARVLLARQQAAMALAESGHLLALEALIAIARSAGAGQGAALDALAIFPPSQPLLGGVVLTTAATVSLAMQVGDLRSLDAIEGALAASDPALRGAALTALGAMGDSRAAVAARTSLHDRDARVRIAAAAALVRLGTGDAAQAVEGLIADDSTALDGLRLARSLPFALQSEGVTKAAAARGAASDDDELRAAAQAALGSQTSPAAVAALQAFLAMPAMQGDAACALARSPSAAAPGAIEKMGETPSLRRLAGRAYGVRRLERGEGSARLDALVASLAASKDARDRAVGVEVLVALGELALEGALRDGDPGVRRAAAMGALALPDGRWRNTLLSHMEIEPDPTTRQILAIGLSAGDPGGAIPTLDLARRIESGGPDAPLAALVLARRHSEEPSADLGALLSSHDALLRAHAARGLGASRAPDASGLLAHAYAIEGDARVRRALVEALAQRGADDPPSAQERVQTLTLAAHLDPDRLARWTAARALVGAPSVAEGVHHVAWLRVVAAEGSAMPVDLKGMLVRADGIALPIAFDEDGYALVPGLPGGDAQLRLAPRPPAYEAPSP